MAFTVSQATSEGILLKRKMVVFPAQLFILIGVIFMIIGIIPLLYYESLEPVFRAVMPLLSILGFIAVTTGLRDPIEQKKSIPDSLYFDNEFGRIRIFHAYSETPEAFIYYNEIQGFYMEQIAETKKSNLYVVLLKKVDGGEWDLFHSKSYSIANRFLELMRSKVNVQATPQRVESTALPISKVKVSQMENHLKIYWKNSVRENALSMGIWLLGMIVATLYAFNFIFTSKFENSFGLEAFLFLVFVIVAAVNFYNLYKLSSIIHSIEVDGNSILVIEKDQQGRIKQEERFNFPEIFSIYYKFNSANPEPKLFLIKQADEDERIKMLASFKGERGSYTPEFFKKQFAINFRDLTTLEVLSIESYIQDFVRKRARIEIL
jgi:hypothetical protein